MRIHKSAKGKLAFSLLILAALGLAEVAHAQLESFDKTRNAAISGHNNKSLSHSSVQACANACLSEMTFSCRSFDYNREASSCDLSDKQALDVGGLKTNYPGSPYDHYSLLEEVPTFGRGIEKGPQVPDVLYAVKQMLGRKSTVVDTTVSGYSAKFDASDGNGDHIQGITMTSTGRIVASVGATNGSDCGGVLMFSSPFDVNSDKPLTWETYCSSSDGIEGHPSSIQAVGEVISVGSDGGSHFYHLPQTGHIQRLRHLDTAGGRDSSGVTYNAKEGRFYSIDGNGAVRPGEKKANVCRTEPGASLLDDHTSFKECRDITTYLSGQGANLLTQEDGRMFLVSTFSTTDFYLDGTDLSETAKAVKYATKCASDGVKALVEGYDSKTPYHDVITVSEIDYENRTSRTVYKAEIGRTQRVQTCVTDRPAFRFAGGVAPYGTKGEVMGLWSGRFLTSLPEVPNSDSYEFAAQNLVPRGTRVHNYSVAIDCDVDGIDNEGTQNTITATFYDDAGAVVGIGSEDGVVGGVLGCGLEDLDIYATTSGPAETVKISTDGSDAFMIDKIELREDGNIVRTNGKNNDKGWCLSTDPTDGNGSWKDAAVGKCESSRSWSYLPSANAPDIIENYSVAIDCDVDGIGDEGTENTITATFYSADGEVIGSGKEEGVVGGIFGCGLEDLDIYATTRGRAAKVKLSTNGSDGFMIDKIELRKDGIILGSHGLDNDKGWCLSTDPTDGSGSWKTAAGNKCETEHTWIF